MNGGFYRLEHVPAGTVSARFNIGREGMQGRIARNYDLTTVTGETTVQDIVIGTGEILGTVHGLREHEQAGVMVYENEGLPDLAASAINNIGVLPTAFITALDFGHTDFQAEGLEPGVYVVLVLPHDANSPMRGDALLSEYPHALATVEVGEAGPAEALFTLP